MANNLDKIEPLLLPDLRRSERIPSLPAWLISRADALAMNLQLNSSGTFQDVPTLPTQLMLSAAQREAISGHRKRLNSLLDLTPERNAQSEAMMLVAVTKLIQALPSQRSSEAQVEAKGDAYMVALDDIPHWAVEAAIRKWYRGQCGTDQYGKPFNYDFVPSPAALRHIAQIETLWIVERVRLLDRILGAVEYIDCAKELEQGRAAMRGLWKTIGNQGNLSDLTFEKAIEIGNEDRPLGIAAE